MRGRNDEERKISKRVNLVSRTWNWQIVCCNFNFSPIWFKLYAFSLHDCFAIKCLSLYPYVLYTCWRWSFLPILTIIGLRDVGRKGEDAYSQCVLMTHFTLKSCQICIISTLLRNAVSVNWNSFWSTVGGLQPRSKWRPHGNYPPVDAKAKNAAVFKKQHQKKRGCAVRIYLHLEYNERDSKDHKVNGMKQEKLTWTFFKRSKPVKCASAPEYQDCLYYSNTK